MENSEAPTYLEAEAHPDQVPLASREDPWPCVGRKAIAGRAERRGPWHEALGCETNAVPPWVDGLDLGCKAVRSGRSETEAPSQQGPWLWLRLPRARASTVRNRLVSIARRRQLE